jgi:hypothetical protein
MELASKGKALSQTTGVLIPSFQLKAFAQGNDVPSPHRIDALGQQMRLSHAINVL